MLQCDHESPPQSPPTPRLIDLLREVAAEFGITTEAMLSRRRCGNLPKARAAFCRRAWALGRHSSPTIGRFINRSHYTVLYYVGALSTKKPGGEHNYMGTALPEETQ